MYPCYIPCFEHCYVKYGKQYDPDKCDAECDYARALLENKKFKDKEEERAKIFAEIQDYLNEIDSVRKHNEVVYTILKHELGHLVSLIEKLAN